MRKAVNVRIEPKPAAVFVTERKNTWCAAAAVQIALNVNGPDARIDTGRARQARIHDLEVRPHHPQGQPQWGAGPLGMVATLEQLGKVDYELRVYDTRAEALREAAKAISSTGHAVILLAWRGAHAWVMTGYRADADPTVFGNAKISGAYIIDPWYPRVSRIWGARTSPGSSRMARRWCATTGPGGGRRAGTRGATATSWPSSRSTDDREARAPAARPPRR